MESVILPSSTQELLEFSFEVSVLVLLQTGRMSTVFTVSNTLNIDEYLVQLHNNNPHYPFNMLQQIKTHTGTDSPLRPGTGLCTAPSSESK